MSIFKDTFRPYVRDQLSLREELIDIGNTSDQGIRTNRNSAHTLNLQSGKTPTLDAGAYYNYTLNKQCIIRMTSMVDYVENVNLEVGGLEGINSFNALRGAALSQNFILEGGVVSDFARVREGQREVRRVSTPRDSFPRPGQRTSLGYGDLAIGADATNDGYGIVPMPGIIDINVRTKSAYGSLREAKVNFECHNRRQLEVLEMLYMRPGYMVTLEWGWNPYINNDGDLVSERRLLEDYFTDGKRFFDENKNEIFDGKSSRIYTNFITQQEIFNAVNKLKEYHCGNYDGFLGFVKNFGFQARGDGGFSCFTELISIGEVIESLKIPNISITDPITNLKGGTEKTTGEKPQVQVKQNETFGNVNQAVFARALEEGIFPRYNGLLGLTKSLVNYSKFNSYSNKSGTLTVDEIENVFDINFEEDTEDSTEIARIESTKTVAGDVGYGNNALGYKKFAQDLVRFNASNIETFLLNSLQLKSSAELRNYLIPAQTAKVSGNTRYGQNQTFIRWDAFCTLINENLITKDSKGFNPVQIISDRIYDNGDNTARIDPLLFTAISDFTDSNQNNLLDYSCDANTCILPLQFETNLLADVGGNVDAYKIEESLSYIPDTTVFPTNYIAGTYNRELPLFYKDRAVKPDPNFIGPLSPIKLEANDKLRRIGSIFLNIEMLNSIAEKNAEEEDYTLGQYINDIWDEVNKACPNHNFVITDDKESNKIYIIDLPIDNNDVPLDLHTFIPFSNKNILREFEYTSNVPNAMSATIAIQSQDPRSIQDIDGVTFAAFNRAIKNRILSTDTESEFDRTIRIVQSEANSLEVKQSNLRRQIDLYRASFFENLRITSNDDTPAFEGNIKGITKEFQKNATYISQALTKTSTFNSVIPLDFSAELDGISGIVIGNMFKVQKDRLPKAYGKTNIAFIVFNEDQKVTGQDWTTSISGKMTILPTIENKPKITGTTVNTFIPEEAIRQTTTTLYDSETEELSQGQENPAGIENVTEFEPVFLKKIKDNSLTRLLVPGLLNNRDIPDELPFTYNGLEYKPAHGFVSVRSTPEVDNAGNNNFVGVFDSWNTAKEDRLLGLVTEIREIPYNEGRVRLLPDSFRNYFDLDTENIDKSELVSFIPDKLEGGRTVKEINGRQFYVVTSTIRENTDMFSREVNEEGEFIPTPKIPADSTEKRYILVSDTTNVSSIWYRIEFDSSVDNRFYSFVSRKGTKLNIDGANGKNEAGAATLTSREGARGKLLQKGLSEFSKTYPCWMRFDVLADTADNAENTAILESNPEHPEPDDEEENE
jgi:hypothetical protein